MDYTTLYEAWKKEKESRELQRLDKQFYAELSNHVRAHMEEAQMLDDKTLRARLATEENDKIERLFRDLMHTRCRKILDVASEGKSLSTDLLTLEEETIYKDFLSAAERVRDAERDILRGKAPKFKEAGDLKHKTILVRFLQDIPPIVGPDTRVYGPFKVEDVASLPCENAESLIKRGIAVRVDIE